MALFKKDKPTQAPQQNATEPKKDASKAAASSAAHAQRANVLIRPHITEKAARLTSVNAYTFEVRLDTNKQEVAKAIKDRYGVDPVKVSIGRIYSKPKRARGIVGRTNGGKKAVVYLKKGDSIELV